MKTAVRWAALQISRGHYGSERESSLQSLSGQLPEVDYLVASQLGAKAQTAFLTDLAGEAFAVEWGRESDLYTANRICQRYRALHLGLVDAAVMAVTERLRADAIATLDLRHFGAVSIKNRPRLLPRDA